MPNTVPFGARDVAEEEKAGLVRAVFDSVAPAYDAMNDLMSLGIHRTWKRVLLDRLAPRPGQALIDVAGGTGDVALGFLARAAARAERAGRSEAPASAVICDINHAMMAAGLPRRAEAAGPLCHVCGDAENLPFPERSFDTYTIAFGIRNVTRRHKALAEAKRVLKRGGRFACLEFSRPVTAGFERLYAAYSDAVIPRLGEAVAGDRESYAYLVESIRRFPAQDAFAAEVEEAGFARVKAENLTGGIAAIHSGWVY